MLKDYLRNIIKQASNHQTSRNVTSQTFKTHTERIKSNGCNERNILTLQKSISIQTGKTRIGTVLC